MKSPLVTSLLLFLCQVILLTSAGQSGLNSVLGSPQKYNSVSMKESLQRRLLKGREVLPAISSNNLPGEPSCDELRAMWRYYKRQSRAEYTNEIPQFGSNPFWDILPPSPQAPPRISSFGPLKGRSKARMRLKSGRNPVFGRVVHKAEKERARKPRPIEEVAALLGRPKSGAVGREPPKDPIIHFSPPPTPTKASSLQKIKEVFREERIREKGPAMRNTNNDDNSKAFGRIIMSPPRGTDGRVANKPRELMTPFEKIRFGHADDILDDGSSPNLNLMAKRRTFPLLKLRLPQNQGSRRGGNDRVNVDQRPVISNYPQTDYEEGSTAGIFSSQIKDGQPDNPIRDNDYPVDGGGEWGAFSPDEQGVAAKPDYSSGNSRNVYQTSPNVPVLLDQSDYSKNLRQVYVPNCGELEGQACNVNSDCSCVGFGLYRCFANECQILSLLPSSRVEAKNDEERPSFWQSGPVETEELGVWNEGPSPVVAKLGYNYEYVFSPSSENMEGDNNNLPDNSKQSNSKEEAKTLTE